MSNQQSDPSDITRARIVRQTPRPRLSLTSLSSNGPNVDSPEQCHGIADAVKVRNRFQHSHNSMLCYSNSIHNSQHGTMLQNIDSSIKSNEKPLHPEQSFPRTVLPANYSTMSVDRVPRCDSLCTRCHADTVVYEQNIKKCHNCGSFSLLKSSTIGTPLSSKSFYSKEMLPTQGMLSEGNVLNTKWRNTADIWQQGKSTPKRKPSKPKNKSKICTLTISSDEEEEKRDKNQKESEKPDGEAHAEEGNAESPKQHENDVTDDNYKEQYRIPKLSDRMKLQGGKTNQDSKSNDSPGLAIVRPSNLLTTTEQGFEVSVRHVQLGSLSGKGMTPLSLKSNALRIEVECSFEVIEANKKKRMNEKYKLALSSVEVSQINVNYENEPMLISVVPSKRYSDIVNKALSKCILDAQSEKTIERQIIFVVNSQKEVFKRTLEKTLPHLQRISPVSTYTIEELTSVLSNMQGEMGRMYATRSASLAAQKKQNPKVIKTIFVYPPPPKKGGIALTNVDVDCLLPGIYLNDIIIDFYLRYLYEEILTQEQRARTYIFNSYFYTRLSKRAFGNSKRNESPMQRMHTQVKKWTRDVDIFEKDFIIIPINEHSHWFLVVICFPSRAELDESVDCSGSSENASSDGIEEVIPEQQKADKANEKHEDQRTSEVITDSIEKSHGDDTLPMDVDQQNPVIDPTKVADEAFEAEGQQIANEVQDFEQKEPDDNLQGTSEKSHQSSENQNTENNNQSTAFQQPCILIFDSLVSGGRSRVFSNLRQYLTLEWKEKKNGLEPEKVFTKNNLKGSFPKIPLQNNDCDCGIYILQFAESFFQHPIINYKFPIRKEKWFTKAHVDAKRDTIKKIINDLEQQCSTGNSSPVTSSS